MRTDRNISDHVQNLLGRIHDLARRWTARFKTREIVDLLEELERSGEYPAVPFILDLCFRAHRAIAAAAARAVTRLLEGIPPLEFVYLDEAVREMASYSSSPLGTKSLKAGDLGQIDLEERHLPGLLGLTSSHPDGHVREETLRALALRRGGAELPFLLLRLNDWVREIRAVARQAVRDRLRPDYARHFVVNLSLVDRLLECGRDRHEHVVREVHTLLASPEASGALRIGCTSEDRAVRRACYLLAVEHRLVDFCRDGLDEADVLVRLRCAGVLLRELPATELPALVDRLAVDRFMPIRREVLRTVLERCPESADERLRLALGDENIAIREFAAYYLRKRTEIDIADLYRHQLAEASGRRLAATILGIGEHGQREDARLVAGFYDTGSPRIKRAVLRALLRLDRDGQADFFTRALLSDLPGVSREARDILRRRRSLAKPATLGRALAESSLAHVRKNVFLVLAEVDKYDGLYYALLAARDADEASEFLARWVSRYNRSYVRPTEDQLERLETALSESRLPARLVSQLRFYLTSA